MNKIKYLLAILLFTTSLALQAIPTVSAATSLILNSSVETATSATQPANWTSNSWGTNTSSFSYANTGNTGTKSLSVTMTSRTDGDAKWVHDAVTVTPDTSYTYSSFYKSTIDTEIDLQYTTAGGAVSYVYGAYVPASANWKEQTITFKTPATATKVVVMQVLAAAGTLQTDDFQLAATSVAPPNTDGNLVVNPSFETVNGSSPANWSSSTWGTNNAAFTYTNTGRSGTKSATVSMTSFTSGDGKWFADPVVVTPGMSYEYNDYYKSAAVTRVVAGFVNSAGVYAYQELAAAPASPSAWALYSANIVAPATATKVTIYHLLDKVGSLNIDDVSLTAAVVPASNVPNASLETAATATTPASWTSSKWGTNTAAFTYVNEGHTGTKSVRTTISNYTDGDAKWYFNPVTNLQQGKQYRWSTWYKTNTNPHAVAMFTRANGTNTFFSMPKPFPQANSNTTWTRYSETFSVPQDAVSVTAFLFVAGNGWVQVDDQSIASYQPTAWANPLLTLTFDDGYEGNVTTALPLLNQYGFKTTQCYSTTSIINGGQASKNKVLAFHKAGHEICSHTITHPFLTSLTATRLTTELRDSQTFLRQLIGKPVVNFASPYGDYSEKVNTEIKNYYGSHRTVDVGYNSKDNFNAYRLRVQNIIPATTAAQVDLWIKQAQADRTWLILVYHRIDNAPDTYDTTPALFAQHLAVMQSSGIQVKTMADALAIVRAQL